MELNDIDADVDAMSESGAKMILKKKYREVFKLEELLRQKSEERNHYFHKYLETLDKYVSLQREKLKRSETAAV